MKITDIKEQKAKRGRYNIFIDDEFCFSADMEDIIKYSISVDREIEEDEIDKLINICEFSKAYNYALSLVSRQDYTSFEIINKLKLKNYSLETINLVLEKLNYYRFIDDERYFKKYINYCLCTKKFGKNKIIAELKKKGFDNSYIDEIIIDEEKEYENIKEIAIKKLNSLNGKESLKPKLYRYLLSKGYEYDLVRKVIAEVLNNIEDFF